ncbi:GNAT family N-acetyltransferase [Vibrio sp. 10N]|uniref:GNAT family N-acetyltransferase n=1 Tax=Vibrio sp. 10N TaxID=3058938 RepID=UPI0028133ADF|nr:GNAT family N-acetyltransferase [Vibrio sp. 10N]
MAYHPQSSLIDSQIAAIDNQLQWAHSQFVRTAIVLNGDFLWSQALVTRLLDHVPSQSSFHLGSAPLEALTSIPANQGKRLLGQDTQLLVVTVDSQFDANSFNAALGTLIGGGLLVIRNDGDTALHPWLEEALQQLPKLEQHQEHICFDGRVSLDWTSRSTPADFISKQDVFVQQAQAIAHIEHVVSGHRKRPLVLTADRGRGKSSALGIAVARFNGQRKLRVLITAPSRAAVTSALKHYKSEMAAQAVEQDTVSLDFIAPDELLQTKPDCDLLLVDEAAALPISMLKKMVESYHRMVISTTVHGYEGCGRGFSVKFLPWLQENRKGCRSFHLEQPIRWSQHDLLEPWAAKTFLLNAELSSLPESLIVEPIRHDALTWYEFNSESALSQRQLLDAAFALLVNAHYQTSPNDLMLLLTSKNMKLYILNYHNHVVGSLLVNREGELADDLIERVQLGVARPAGHLVPIELCNHLGLSSPAEQSCLRVMRIAVHPLLQSRGLGSEMLTQLSQSAAGDVDYLATNFGTTPELVHFWRENEFVATRIGSAKDKSSGTYSGTFVRSLSSLADKWQTQAQNLFGQSLSFTLRSSAQDVEPKLALALLSSVQSSPYFSSSSSVPLHPLVINYVKGGNSFNSVRPFLLSLLFSAMAMDNNNVSLLVVAVIAQEWSWSKVAEHFGLTGKKQAEQTFRSELGLLVDFLQCK